MTPLRYSPDVEQIPSGEQEAIDGIIKGMTAQPSEYRGNPGMIAGSFDPVGRTENVD